jgi:hypothetical protein
VQWGLQASHGHLENSVVATIAGNEVKLTQYWSVQMTQGLTFETRLAAECARMNVDVGGIIKAKAGYQMLYYSHRD